MVPQRWSGRTRAANCSLKPRPKRVVCVACSSGARASRGRRDSRWRRWRRRPRRRRRRRGRGRGCRRRWRRPSGRRRRRARGRRIGEASRRVATMSRALIAPPPLSAAGALAGRRRSAPRARRGRRRCGPSGRGRCGRPSSGPGAGRRRSGLPSSSVTTPSPRAVRIRSETSAACGRLKAKLVASRPAANGFGKLM